jgi:hypothetical protein
MQSGRGWLNATAPLNMPRIFVTLLTFQALRGWLNATAPLNTLQHTFQWDSKPCDAIAQFSIPVIFQLFITPFHITVIYLTGLSTTSSSISQSWSHKSKHVWEAIRKGYANTTLVRMVRIFPSFGVGGAVNTYFRKLQYTSS